MQTPHSQKAHLRPATRRKRIERDGFVTKEWLESDEFKNLTQEQVVDMVKVMLSKTLHAARSTYSKTV